MLAKKIKEFAKDALVRFPTFKSFLEDGQGCKNSVKVQGTKFGGCDISVNIAAMIRASNSKVAQHVREVLATKLSGIDVEVKNVITENCGGGGTNVDKPDRAKSSKKKAKGKKGGKGKKDDNIVSSKNDKQNKKKLFD